VFFVPFCGYTLKTEQLYTFLIGRSNLMRFDTVTIVAIAVIVIAAGYLIIKRRSRAS